MNLPQNENQETPPTSIDRPKEPWADKKSCLPVYLEFHSFSITMLPRPRTKLFLSSSNGSTERLYPNILEELSQSMNALKLR
jgi:hypothetical protein